jgi:hypothetical protein
MLQVDGTIDGPSEDDEYVSNYYFLHVGSDKEDFLFTQAGAGHNIIPSIWILLDSQLTVSVFKNRALLSNIRPGLKTLRVHTHRGTQMSTGDGDRENFRGHMVQHQFPRQHPLHVSRLQGLSHHHGHVY